MAARRKPEVMAPAGHWPQLHAAIEAGADAVYFGLKHFTARAKAGFDLAELPEVFRTLHRRGVRGFVTFNTLVFDHEWREAARALAAIAEAGADAIIVQDPGILALARAIAPDLELHASTQMSIADARGAAWAQQMGASRVTLARELSLDEIRAIAKATSVELEVFVHGALCVAYSGQCFSSEAWGGRSANRGQCAQACRLPYEMLVDGALKPLGDARYLLSPGDLYALHQVPDLIDIGVSTLKIEGRYKDAEYVAAATSAYRKAVDDAWAARPLSITPAQELQLEQVYSRGLGPFFMTGTDHQAVVRGRAPRHRGVMMGRVGAIQPPKVLIEPAAPHSIAPLKPGDGVVFDAADWRDPAEAEEGGRLYQVAPAAGGQLSLQFGQGELNFARIRPGDLLWRTHDPALDKVLRPYLEPAAPIHRQVVDVHVTARANEALHTTWTLAARPHISVSIASPDALPSAQNRAIEETQLRAQFERLGSSAYSLGGLTLDTDGSVFAPASLLNAMRRQAVEALEALQSQPVAHTVRDPQLAADDLLQRATAAQHAPAAEPSLHLLVRTPEQLDAALSLAPASITLDYLDLYGLKPSVDRVLEAKIPVRVATPRILKPGEERIVDFLLRLGCPLLVRPAGLLHHLQSLGAAPPLTGDFSLNAANAVSAHLLLGMNLDRITPTHDLNAAQVAALAHEAGAHRIEAIAYQHLPVFHTEHCVFARFLSTGSSYKDCGRPCEHHRVELRDVNRRAHPVLADVGCRNAVFGAEAQECSAHLDSWLAAGIAHYRLEFAHESAAQVRAVTGAFAQALSGAITSRQLSERLRRTAPQGTTEGSLFVPANHLTLPVLQ
ncbi:MAG TPA: U32 family peptidase [Bryobacteraceae bacterium]|nr:U32 family peptidase [Bryobacteraceae bacterium]